MSKYIIHFWNYFILYYILPLIIYYSWLLSIDDCPLKIMALVILILLLSLRQTKTAENTHPTYSNPETRNAIHCLVLNMFVICLYSKKTVNCRSETAMLGCFFFDAVVLWSSLASCPIRNCGAGGGFSSHVSYRMGPPFDSVQLVQITPTMVYGTQITIVTGAYNKPTYNWGASHCNMDVGTLTFPLG